MTTRVINIKSKQPFDVYNGNRIRFHLQKYPQTRGGNPYAKYLKKYGRNKVIRLYKEDIMNKPELLKSIPLELKDKRLGCWCKPLPCHSDILAQIADSS